MSVSAEEGGTSEAVVKRRQRRLQMASSGGCGGVERVLPPSLGEPGEALCSDVEVGRRSGAARPSTE